MNGEAEKTDDKVAVTSQDNELNAVQLAIQTPTNDELLKRAKRFPPPPKWFEEDEERPF